jgi:hypothetical protein
MKNILMMMALAAVPVFSQSGSFISFIEGPDVVNEVLGAPPAPCVPRLPAYELSAGEGMYNWIPAGKLHEDCREAFAESVRNFTDEEKDMLTKYVVLIDSVIDAKIPALNSFPWSFAVIGDSSEFGIPNSSEHIILTDWLLREMRDWAENQSSMQFVGMEILVHEKVRLLQSVSPEPFEKFFSEIWGFHKIRPLRASKQMLDQGFFFPRVPPNEWVIRLKGKEYIMPALLMRDAGKEAGGTVQRVAITVDFTSKGFNTRPNRRTVIDYRDLRLVPLYRKKFPQSEYDYHPVELSADLLAKFLVMQYVSASYGTAPARTVHYSQIDVLMKYVNDAAGAAPCRPPCLDK